MNSVPAADSASPIGAMEKMARPGRPDACSAPLATRKAGAPMIVIVVPNDAPNDNGISSLEGGMLRSRESVSVTGSITAVVVT